MDYSNDLDRIARGRAAFGFALELPREIQHSMAMLDGAKNLLLKAMDARLDTDPARERRYLDRLASMPRDEIEEVCPAVEASHQVVAETIDDMIYELVDGGDLAWLDPVKETLPRLHPAVAELFVSELVEVAADEDALSRAGADKVTGLHRQYPGAPEDPGLVVPDDPRGYLTSVIDLLSSLVGTRDRVLDGMSVDWDSAEL